MVLKTLQFKFLIQKIVLETGGVEWEIYENLQELKASAMDDFSACLESWEAVLCG